MRQGIKGVAQGQSGFTPVYVITSQTGTPVNPSNIRRFFNTFLKKINVRRIRLHDIRHTVANLGLQNDIPIEVLSQAFGHTRIDTTKQIYAGNVPRYTERFVQGISQVLPKVVRTESPAIERLISQNE
jgi:integrase